MGGTTTGVNEFPMMAGLVDRTQRIFCGSTIINNRQVLTAAHCVPSTVSPLNLGILVGDHDLERGDTPLNFDRSLIRLRQLY